mmetsp:Transcript_6941/g.26760  ORF Transcript_6941/g.26760 Transcript_6941/m.26760 type:complete len:246 (+) Transcript_6941:797-1534(+)
MPAAQVRHHGHEGHLRFSLLRAAVQVVEDAEGQVLAEGVHADDHVGLVLQECPLDAPKALDGADPLREPLGNREAPVLIRDLPQQRSLRKVLVRPDGCVERPDAVVRPDIEDVAFDSVGIELIQSGRNRLRRRLVPPTRVAHDDEDALFLRQLHSAALGRIFDTRCRRKRGGLRMAGGVRMRSHRMDVNIAVHCATPSAQAKSDPGRGAHLHASAELTQRGAQESAVALYARTLIGSASAKPALL